MKILTCAKKVSADNKFEVRWYDVGGAMRSVNYPIGDLPVEEARRRAVRAVMLGALDYPEIEQHRLLVHEAKAHFWYVYLDEAEEDQVNSGRVTDEDIEKLYKEVSS